MTSANDPERLYIAGRVLNQYGEGIGGIEIIAERQDPTAPTLITDMLSSVSNARGVYQLYPLAAGDYRLSTLATALYEPARISTPCYSFVATATIRCARHWRRPTGRTATVWPWMSHSLGTFGRILAIWFFVIAAFFPLMGAYVTFAGLCPIEQIIQTLPAGVNP